MTWRNAFITAAALALIAAAPRPAPTLASIVGLSDSEAKARLGAADLERTEGAGALWTYRLKDCALLVFLRKGPGQAFRVTGADSSLRRRGDPPLPVGACIQQAMDRRSSNSR